MMYFYNNGRLLLILFSLLFILLNLGCTTTPKPIKLVSDSRAPVVTGHLLLADGSTPANNVAVYVPTVNTSASLFINELTLSSTPLLEHSCKKPQVPYSSFACTDVNGRFELPIFGLAALPIPVVAKINKHTVSTTIALNELDSDIGVITFPGRQTLTTQIQAEEKDKIAIVFDLLDPYEEINRTLVENDINPDLIRIDMLNNFYEIYEINENYSDVEVTTLQELVKDQNKDTLADISDYDIIFINCRDEDDISKLNSNIRKELLNFVSNGGELFITSWSFQIEEPVLDLNDYI